VEGTGGQQQELAAREFSRVSACPAVQLERLQSGRQINEAAGRRRRVADLGISGSVLVNQSLAAQA